MVCLGLFLSRSVIFFFSSRRRHTRFDCDWSSDVCSSDLPWARELGFDACMYMLHKTFGAPKGGGGPAVGAYGCSDRLAPFLPGPVVLKSADGYALDADRPQSAGKVREFWGNIPQVVKAYAWARCMGADGIEEASNLSVLANNYMERGLLAIKGISRSNPDVQSWRLEMTRYSLE